MALVPDLLVSATLPRWWTVSPTELHAVALYQRSGEELLTASVKDPQVRVKVVSILSDRMTPQRLERAEQALTSEEALAAMLPRMMPADTFYLAAEFRRRYPTEAASSGPAGRQLDDHARQHAEKATGGEEEGGVSRPRPPRVPSRVGAERPESEREGDHHEGEDERDDDRRRRFLRPLARVRVEVDATDGSRELRQDETSRAHVPEVIGHTELHLVRLSQIEIRHRFG